ncbi:MAG: sulfite exporter TauE/SafE family protein [Bacteroidetes bacterium]|nr:sulfite exporter TauE/SafE family protein [Bacteroidota bacterium]
MSAAYWLLLPLVGCVGGFLAGMLGVGGGVIFIPLLTWLFTKDGISGPEVVKYTLGNSIFLVFISGISGIARQAGKQTLDWRRMLLIGIPGAGIALLWSLCIAHGLPDFRNLDHWMAQHGDWYQKDKFQLVFLGFLLISIGNMLFGRKSSDQERELAPKKQAGMHLLVAALAGTVVALSGLGGGVVMVPLFRMFLHMPLKKATALSLSIIPFLSLAPLLSYAVGYSPEPTPMAHAGYLVWPYALPMAAGVIVFARIGMKTAAHTPERWLRLIFASLSTLVLAKTIYEILYPG